LDGVMSLLTNRYRSFETTQFNKTSMIIIIIMVEVPLIAIFNEHYKTYITMPDNSKIERE